MAIIHTEIRDDIPSRIENDDIVRLYNLWIEKQKDHGLPDRAEFSIDGLDWCSDNLMLLKALPGDDFEYCHYGRLIADAAGFDMTGKRTSDFDSDVGLFFIGKYRDCQRDRVPIYTTHRADHVTSVRTWERIMLPLADAHGDRFILAYNRPLEFKHELLEKILNTSRDGILVLDPDCDEDGQIRDFSVHLANREIQVFLQLTERQMLDRTIGDLFPEQLARPLDQICRTVFASRRSDVFDIAFGRMEDKVLYQVCASCVGMGVAITLSDQSDLKRQEAKLVRLATTDPLTGAMNRRAFFELAEFELRRAPDVRSRTTVLLLDIDRFKLINDTHGHHIGDEVLVAFVDACMGTLREDDRFARLGGEEFAILLPGTGLDEAADLAERLRARIDAMAFQTEVGPIPVTVSAGVADVFQDEENAIDHALARADKALYEAKEAGRNRVVVADPMRPSTSARRIASAV